MLIQSLLNGLILGAVYTLIGISFALIFVVCRFFHFAHGVAYILGAYGMFAAISWLGLSRPIAVVFGIAVSASFGFIVETFIYSRLRQKQVSSLVLLLVSLGVYVIIQNAISLLFGDYIQSIRINPTQGAFGFWGIRITLIQIIIICACLCCTILISCLLSFTRFGKSIRAVASDAMLSSVSGIESNMVILLTFIVGSSLAGVTGILYGLDYGITPTMGLNALMMGVIAVIIGGIRSISGIALGALLLAMAQQLGAWYLGSQWQDAIAFIILVIFLLFKPEGFFGNKLAKTIV